MAASIVLLLAAALGQMPAGLARPEGEGIAVGDKSRLHMSMDAGSGYDSNPNLVSRSETGSHSAAFLLVRPRANLSIPGRTYYLNASGDVRFRAYYPRLGGPRGEYLRLLDGDVVLDLGPTERNRQLEVDCVTSLGRTVNPGYALLGSRVGFTHSRTQASVTWRPPTRTLTATLRYDLRFRWYDGPRSRGWLDALGLHISDSSVPNPSYLNNRQHNLSLTGIWALLRDLKVHGTLYASQFSYAESNSPYPAHTHFGMQTGFAGPLPLTTQLSLRVDLGASLRIISDPTLGGGASSKETEFGGVDAATELVYGLDAYDRVAVGYRHRVEPVVIYREFSSNDAYLRSEHRLIGRYIGRAQLSYSHRIYTNDKGGADGRAEHFVEARCQLGVPLGDRLGVGLTVLYQQNVADRTGSSAFGGSTDTSYRRFFLLLSLSAVR